MKQRLLDLVASVRAHGFWLQVAGVTVVVLLITLALGRTAHARADKLEQEADRLERIVAAYAAWAREFQQASTAEAFEWSESEASVRTLGLTNPKGIGVTQLVARTAEEIGLGDVRVRMVALDTLSPPPPRQLGELSFAPAGFGLTAEFGGSVAEAAEFIRSLPLAVEPRSAEITRGEAARARVSMFVFESAPR